MVAAVFCECSAAEMNKRITDADLVVANGRMQKVAAAQQAASALCVKSTEQAFRGAP